MRHLKNYTRLLMLFLGTSLFAQQTVYVSSTGAGLMDGSSEANAYGNFTTALADINSAGDILRVIGDMSPGNHNLSSKGFAYTIEGDSGGSTLTGTSGATSMFTVDSNSGTGQNVTFRNIIFSSATNTSSGGGAFSSTTDATITFEDCVFNGNSSTSSVGGGAVYINNASATATFTRCTFYQNSNNTGLTSSGQGGAIFFGGGQTSTLTNCTFFENTISRTNNDFGAAIRIDGGSNITMNRCLFYENRINNGAGNVADVGASGGGTQNFTYSQGQLVNANIDNVTNSIVLKKPSIGTAVDLTNSSLAWNATTNRVEFTAPSVLTDDTPIDFGSDNSDIGAWDSKINLFRGTTNSDWATGTNWSSTAAPASDENVTLLSDSPSVVISSSTGAVCNDLSVNASSSLTINSGGSLIVNGTSSGAVSYVRNLANGSQWYLMASPVIGETYDDAWVTTNSIASGSGDNRGISTWDNTSSDTDTDGGGPDTATGNWRYMQALGGSTFNVGQGYGIIRSATGDVTFTGTGVHTSTQTFAITQGASNNFNLVGNPFSAYLNLGDFFGDNPTTTVLNTATAWFWNGSSYDARTSGLNPTFEIAPGQGFFIEAAADTNLTFDFADISHQGSDSFQRASTDRTEINLFISKGDESRYTNVYYIEGKTTGHDDGYDAQLFGGEAHSLAVFTHLLSDNVGDKYQLQSLPNSDLGNMIIPVGVIAEAGSVSFSVKASNLPSGYKVFLEDKNTGDFIRLDEQGSKYDVTFNAAVNSTGRLYMHVATSTLNTGSFDLANISAYQSTPNNLKVVGIQNGTTQLRMFNILGKQVLNTSFEANGVNDVTLPNLRTGVYIIQINSEKGTINKKIIIE